MAKRIKEAVCNGGQLTEPGVKLGVLGVPMCKGQRKKGAEKGAAVLRQGCLIQKLKDLGCQVTDYGDLMLDDVDDDPNCGKVKNPRYVAKATLKIANKVQEVLPNEGSCIILGGDHSLAIGTIIGHARVQPDVAVLWIDAHADINTPLTSGSGNIHGMSLSFLTRELDTYVPHLPGWENIKPCIDGKQIAWIGLRSVDHGESKIIDQFGLHAFSMQEVDRHGIRDVLDMALKAVDPEGVRPIHVSFDVDSMDPAYTPCTGTPVNGGLTVREISYIAEEIAKTGRLAMLDIVEVNPEIGSEQELEKTIRSIIDVVTRFYGQRRRGYYKPDFHIPEVPEKIADRHTECA